MKCISLIFLLAIVYGSIPTANAEAKFDFERKYSHDEIMSQGKIIDRYANDGDRIYIISYKKNIFACIINHYVLPSGLDDPRTLICLNPD